MDTLTDTRIALPLTADTIAGFAAVAPHASKDKVSPIITGVQVTQRHLIATDRYTVGRFEHTTLAESIDRHGENGPADPDAAIVIPREVAEWISKRKLAHRGQALTLALTPESATIHYGEDTDGTIAESRTFEAMTGNYPPVARLFPESSDAPVEYTPTHLGVDHLAKLIKSATAIGRASKTKNQPIGFQYQESATRKPMPVLANIGTRFDCLIQPILKLR